MSTYTSKPVTVNKPAEEIYARFCDLSTFASQLDKLPEEQRAKVGDVTFDKNSISINTPQVGELRFEVKERVAHSKVVFGTASSPVPMSMIVNIAALTDDSAEITAVIDVEIPMMLRPFVGPKLQEAADKFGDLMSNLSK